MNGLHTYQDLSKLVTRLRDDLNNKELLLLYAYNRTGKTRLSMAFKDRGKRRNNGNADTLYFNAFTEDLFIWENDLENDSTRGLKVNYNSRFFDGFTNLGLEPTIDEYLKCYADFDFDIEYKEVQQGGETFSKPSFVSFSKEGEANIKISRGEEKIFIWCLFMAICERILDGHESYQWVKYLYIDDPISSLDDNNAIAVACDLAILLRRATNRKDENDVSAPIRVIFSSHHSLFFNVMCNEIGRSKEGEPSVRHKRYFLHRPNSEGRYTLRATEDTPFFHHVASLVELQKAAEPGTGTLYTFHFNALRSIMEKTAAFFGHSDISFCLKALDDDENRALFNRILNLLSHGKYAIHEPTLMGEDNQVLFRQILNSFINHFKFDLPEILGGSTTVATL
ncbi:anticodon nuclease [Pseudomonas daroniae]|uniref:Anticodon nuclease n=1 Tax=Phytopseudomonas daroniae TaxID=2487519 RepID=A0A4Q9QF06_9GAMM|nr:MULTISPECIES: AAA family ATPase [Pseudomonas]TBU71441.1 anticodon nuclease [Pseudomonas daroniae]TBU74753.1 anticodon nuclease [Pseudomonas sp. FRB 228]TBU86644.1 anticodon nuclease [Pseudomonas daroniae]